MNIYLEKRLWSLGLFLTIGMLNLISCRESHQPEIVKMKIPSQYKILDVASTKRIILFSGELRIHNREATLLSALSENDDAKIIASYNNSSILNLNSIDDTTFYYTVRSYADSLSYNLKTEVLHLYSERLGVKRIFETESEIIKVDYNDQKNRFVVITITGANSNRIIKHVITTDGRKLMEAREILIGNELYYQNSKNILLDNADNLKILVKSLREKNKNFVFNEGGYLEPIVDGNLDAVDIKDGKIFCVMTDDSKDYYYVHISGNEYDTINKICSYKTPIYSQNIFLKEAKVFISFTNTPNSNFLSSKTYLFYSNNRGYKWQQLNFEGNGIRKIIFLEEHALILSKDNNFYSIVY